MEPQTTSQSLFIKLLGVGITLFVVVGVILYMTKSTEKEDTLPKENEVTTATKEESIPEAPKQNQTSEEQVPTQAGTAPTPSYVYKNGTYEASGVYSSPAGNESISISLTILDDVVTNATFTGNAENPGSKNWQGKFNDGFSQAVVGKKIDELKLTIVNGSSLTPKGFNDALAKIKREAKI